MLAISCFVIIASCLLESSPEGVVRLAFLPVAKLPPLCLSSEWFGIRCPGCGLTRSFVHLAHGHWQAAWQAHRLGWLLAGFVLLQIPYRILGICVWPKSIISFKVRKRTGQCLISLLLINWIMVMVYSAAL